MLATAQELTRKVRNAQRNTWFPLVLLGLVTLAETPFDRFGHRAILACGHDLSGTTCTFYKPWVFFYWPVALVAAYFAITAYYLRRSRSLGVGTRVRPYAVAGLALALVLTAIALWADSNPDWSGQAIILQKFNSYQLVVPVAEIGLGLLALAWVDHSWPLLGFALVYVFAGLGSAHYIRTRFPETPWAFLPHVLIPGGVLLLGGLGFWLAQRLTRSGEPRPVGPDAG